MRLRHYREFGLGALRARLWGRKTPLSVMFSVTNRCNSKCLYCDIPLRRQQELSTRQALELIDAMGCGGVQKLSLWGGEPLLRNDIGTLIERAKANGMIVNIDSNGYLVPQKLNEIRHLDFIILSFDGEKEFHDRNREPGSYERFFNAMKAIDGRIPVWSLTVLTKHNIHSVDFIVGKAREYGFRTMFQVPYHPTGIGSQASHADLLAGPDEYQAVFRHLIELKKDGAPIISSTRYLHAVSSWPFFPNATSLELTEGMPRCCAGTLFCNIDTNGDMFPCSPMINHMAPLSALELGFKDAFSALPTPPCRSCLSACSVEANLVFSFDRLSILEWRKAVTTG